MEITGKRVLELKEKLLSYENMRDMLVHVGVGLRGVERQQMIEVVEVLDLAAHMVVTEDNDEGDCADKIYEILS